MPSSISKGVALKESPKPVSKARALLSETNRGGVEAGETSFRVYYGATGAAVPFMWESQPGTPKHPIFDNSNDDILPPLTPPPSYNSSSSTSATSSSRKSRKSRVLINAFLSSISRKSSSHVNPIPVLSSSSYSGPLSWSTSSSSSSSLSSPHPVRVRGKKHRTHHRSLSFCSGSGANKFPLFDDDEQEYVAGSPNSRGRMCFGFKHVKNAILSIKGH